MAFHIIKTENYTIIKLHPQTASLELLELVSREVAAVEFHYIIDFTDCKTIDGNAIPVLVNMHEESYSANHSLIFTCMNPTIMTSLKKTETDLLINITPTMTEAIEIINMEQIERDLFSEE